VSVEKVMDPNMSGGAEGGNVTDGSYLNAAYTIPEQLESVGAAGDELREQVNPSMS